MNIEITTLFNVLSAYINKQKYKPTNLSPQQWIDLYRLSKSQGVTAIVFEELKSLPKEVTIPKDLVLRWLSNSVSIERLQRHKMELCDLYAKHMNEYGLKTLVLKGVSVSRYYKIPFQREFGDLDCCMFSLINNSVTWDNCYEKCNMASERRGYSVKRDYYKHSHIHYKTLEIENHQFCLPVRGSKLNKELERHLRSLINASLVSQKDQEYLMSGTNLYCPPADFNALFLTAHSLNHFLYESIKVRHLLDWALFLKAEHKNINWDSFWVWCEKMHYKRFVLCLNHICKTRLGLQVEIPQPAEERFDIEKISERILNDVFNGNTLYNKKVGKWKERFLLVKNMFASRWKFRDLRDQSMIGHFASLAVGFMIDRNPKI